MSTQTLMTVDEFAQMNTAETEDYELVDGELIPLASGNPIHADVRGRAEFSIRSYFERNPIGRVFSEVDCRMNDETVRRPDVSVFLGERVQQIDLYEIPVPFAPDIAIEILSPSESAIEVNRKVRTYLGAGSKEVWIVDHINGEFFVHSNAGIRRLLVDDVLESALLPGFAAAMSSLFAGL